MPIDPVASLFEATNENNMAEAEELIRANKPELLDGVSPSTRQDNIRKLAKAISIQNAQQQGGIRGAIGQEFAETQPTDLFGVGGASMPFARHLIPGGADTAERMTLGNAADLAGLGPESLQERSGASMAATGAAIAASAIPQGRAVGQIINRLTPLSRSANFVNRGEQILTPALAAGATAAVGTVGGNVIEQMNGVPDLQVKTDSQDPGSPASLFADSLNTAKKEFLFESGGATAVFAGLGILKAGAKFVRGDKEFFENAMESLKRAGLKENEFGLQEVSDRALISSASGTIGILPLPVIRTRFLTAKERVSGALGRERDAMFQTISPRFALIRELKETDPDAADALLSAGEERLFRQIDKVRSRYGVVRQGLDTAVDAGIRREALTSTAASVRSTALESLVRERKQNSLPRVVAAKGEKPRGMFSFAVDDPEINTVMEQVRKWSDDDIPLTELINLRANIRARLDVSDTQKALSKRDRASLLSFESALDTDIEATIGNEASEGTRALYERLRTLDGDWITLLAGHVGRRSRRVQQTFGREKLSESAGGSLGIEEGSRGLQRQQGALDMSDFLDSMLTQASPEEIRQFGILMRSAGPEGVASLRFSLARKLDEAIEAGTDVVTDAKIEVTRADVIEAMLFGKNKLSKKARRFRALSREAGVSPELLTDFTRAARTLWRQIPKDPNQFITRSFVLSKGNPKSLLKLMSAGLLGTSATGGATAVGGVPAGGATALLGLFALERYSALATKPQALKAVLTLINPKTGTGAKARAIDRLAANQIFREWFGDKNAQINQPNAGGGALDFVRQNAANVLDTINRQASDVFDQIGFPGDAQ